MTIEEAQKLLRQQVGIARQLFLILENASSRPVALSACQACLLSLRLGLFAYLGALFKVSRLRSLNDCLCDVEAGDYRTREILNLLNDEESWLLLLGKYFDSLERLPKSGVSPGGSGQSFGMGRLGDNNVIASSLSQSESHWSALAPMELNAFVDELAELLARHSESDQEF